VLLIVIDPSVEIVAIEAYALFVNRNFCQMRSYFDVEAMMVHPEVSRGIPKPNDTGLRAFAHGCA
jgi:hypothetical protein